MTKRVTPPAPAAAGAAAPAAAPAPFDAQIQMDEADILPIHQFYAEEIAINIFAAGCLPQMKHHIALNKTWSTWSELEDLAIAVEATVHPNSLTRQMSQFNSSGGHQVNAVHTTATAESSEDAQVAAQYGKQKSNKNQGQNKKQNQQQQHKNKPKAAPHPQQQNTHTHPVTCYYCGGKYHTERHCLAKQNNKASAPVAATAPCVVRPAQVHLPSQGQAQPQFYTQPQQQQAMPGPSPYVAPQGYAPQDAYLVQQAQVQTASPMYPNPHFPIGE